jgi:hypothetical protein
VDYGVIALRIGQVERYLDELVMMRGEMIVDCVEIVGE